MLAAFQEHMQQTFKVSADTNLLIAFSGGLDSTVLAQLCLDSGYPIALAHCNFNLRDRESDADAEFAEQWALDRGVKLHVTSFETKKIKKSKRGSIQMVARQLRYQWFAKLLESQSYQFVLTAHHADDVLETFLINLSRGSGLKGLVGIPERNQNILRPLLPFAKQQLIDFAKEKKLIWREDTSNAELKYLRNNIRHTVVPQLKKSNSNFLTAFQQSLSHLKESKELLKSTRIRLQASLFVAENDFIRIDIKALQKLQPSKAYMHLLFEEFGFTAWQDVTALLTAETGREIQSKTHRLLKDRNHMLLTEVIDEPDVHYFIEENSDTISTPILLHFLGVPELGESDKKVAYVDNELLSYPLVLRKRQKGDYFYPLGMKGKKKVSKFLKDEKVNGFEKEKQWVLCSGDAIVWLVGRRADNRFKVTSKTKTIVKITWEE